MENKRYTDSWGLVHYDDTLHLDNGTRHAVCGAVSLERTMMRGVWTYRPHSAPIPYRYCAPCAHAWEQQERILERYAAFVTARLHEDEMWAVAASTHYRKGVIPGGAQWHWVGNDTDEPVPVVLNTDGEDVLAFEDHYISLRSVQELPSYDGTTTLPIMSPYVDEIHTGVAGHIIRQDPARTLRRVEAARRMLDRALAEGHYCASDSWESCPAYQKDGPCDCGRDDRALAILQDLAVPYTDHPDHPEA